MPKKNIKTYAFDIDGVICSLTNGDYLSALPNKKAIKKINQIYSEGNKVIVFTARYMGRTNNNPEKAKKIGYEQTVNQLKNWGLMFDELFMGKPSYDVFIDDKAYNYDENWIKKI